MLLRKMFKRQWLLTTILVIAGAGLCTRLGIWQLNRLEQRQEFNRQVVSMRAADPLDLNREIPKGIDQMEWRSVQVIGKFDHENQIALRNQYYRNQNGYHLITPFLFDGGAVLVDRGWIPSEGNGSPADWRKYDLAGRISLTGQLRLGGGKPAFGGVADPWPVNGKLEIWTNLDLKRISGQINYSLLPVYIQPLADENDQDPPIPYQPTIELTEGPHLGYALQWFSFAAILFFGYPLYLRKQDEH